MAFIRWGSHLATGHQEIDEQHRTLIDTFNRLEAVAARGPSNHEELEGLLIFLRNFALAHFRMEQELMARHRYPAETEHRRLHTDLAAQLEAILDAYHKGTTLVSPVTLEYLDAWLSKHIQEEDFRLAEFLNQAQAEERGQA